MRFLVVMLCLIAVSASADYVQKTNAFVPGLYQWKTDQHAKSIVLTTLNTAATGTYVYGLLKDSDAAWDSHMRAQYPSKKWYATLKAYKRAEDWEAQVPKLMWLAIGMYGANMLDAMLYKQSAVILLPNEIRVAVAF